MFDLILSIWIVVVPAVPVVIIMKISRRKSAVLILYVFLLIWVARFLVGYFGDVGRCAVNLMYACPLFYPLMNMDSEGPRKELHVIILGDGRCAAEMFKSVFWCGQMSDVTLCIDFVSENASTIRRRITRDCPELLDSGEPDSPILNIHPCMDNDNNDTPDRNPPYAHISFAEELTAELLHGTDYYIIVFEDDRDAVSYEEEIRRRTEAEMSCRRRVIAVKVGGSDTAEILRSIEPNDHEALVFPFGMVSDIYSVRNIYMDEVALYARQSNALYNSDRQKAFFGNEYNYWSDIARAVHAPYKAFALGRLAGLDFGETGKERFVVRETKGKLTEDEENMSAYMEHRRWNAFMRTKGFSSLTGAQYDKWFHMTGTHKSLDLKLHNCLVECAKSPTPLPADLKMDYRVYDRLDKASYDACHATCSAGKREMTYGKLMETEYKRYDHPRYGGDLESALLMPDRMTEEREL